MDLSDSEVTKRFRVVIADTDDTMYNLNLFRFKRILNSIDLPKEDFVEEWQKISDMASDVFRRQDDKSFKQGILRVAKKWTTVSHEFLQTLDFPKDVLDAYTNLQDIPNGLDSRKYFREFSDCLYEHIDRMWFNPWIRCQLCLANAIEKAQISI